ncbi:hypothetical protein D3C83_147160 [compost metagenome]
MRDATTTATFDLRGSAAQARWARVLGEDRTVQVREGRFMDEFQPYDVHLYALRLT